MLCLQTLGMSDGEFMKGLNITLSILSLSFIAACAGPESYEAKMNRYTPKTLTKNQVPEIKSNGFTFSGKGNRAPASVVVKKDETADPTLEVNYTNKKLYFLTLLGQYEGMKKYSAQFDAPAINICPHFHTSLLQHKDAKATTFSATVKTFNNKKFTYDKARLKDEQYVARHPELLLPLSQNETTPRVVDIMRSEAELTEIKMNDFVHRALDIHLSKTYTEIRELCEYGVSDNYYIYENLITHIKSSDFKAVDSNLNTLLKTTVFSNIALVTSLEKNVPAPARSIASIKETGTSSTYANEMMARLNVEWAKEYFEDIKTSR